MAIHLHSIDLLKIITIKYRKYKYTIKLELTSASLSDHSGLNAVTVEVLAVPSVYWLTIAVHDAAAVDQRGRRGRCIVDYVVAVEVAIDPAVLSHWWIGNHHRGCRHCSCIRRHRTAGRYAYLRARIQRTVAVGVHEAIHVDTIIGRDRLVRVSRVNRYVLAQRCARACRRNGE